MLLHPTEVAARTPRFQVLVESPAVVAHAKNQVVQIAQSTASLRWEEPDGILAYQCCSKLIVLSSQSHGVVVSNNSHAEFTGSSITEVLAEGWSS